MGERRGDGSSLRKRRVRAEGGERFTHNHVLCKFASSWYGLHASLYLGVDDHKTIAHLGMDRIHLVDHDTYHD